MEVLKRFLHISVLIVLQLFSVYSLELPELRNEHTTLGKFNTLYLHHDSRGMLLVLPYCKTLISAVSKFGVLMKITYERMLTLAIIKNIATDNK